MRLPLAALAVGTLLLAGCGGHAHAAPSTMTSSPDPTAAALQTRAATGRSAGFSGTYALTSPSGSALATVRVFLTPAAFRVDVVEKAATTSLYGGATRESVACTGARGIPTVCYAVAKPGAAIPTRFDAGVQRVFRDDLPALASGTAGLTVATTAPLATLADRDAGTQCYTVSSPAGSSAVDAGTYCLDADGLLTGFRSTSGVLTLTSHAGSPTSAQLKPPTPPKALPTPSPAGSNRVTPSPISS